MIAAAIVGAVLVAFLAWAVRGRSAAIFAPNVWHGPRDRPAIALTFDDGPSEATSEILDILARHKAAATFFLCGANVERLPDVAHAITAAGHEVGNHSYGHPYLFLQAPGAIEADLRHAQEVIQKYTGALPAWFRPPYGARWFGLRSAQRRLGLTGVMWTAIGYDWNSRAEVVVARMAAQAANGAILCLHDGRELRAKPEVKETVEAVRRLVPMLLDQGYKLETLSRLLCPKN